MKEELIQYLKEDNTFKQVNVKLAYEIPTVIEYPLVVITEILNSENDRYSTIDGEQVTNITYQVESICEATELTDGTILDATRSAKLLAIKVSKLFGGERYNFKRVGDSPLRPVNADKTIMRYIDRYEGCLFLKQNIIYRR